MTLQTDEKPQTLSYPTPGTPMLGTPAAPESPLAGRPAAGAGGFLTAWRPALLAFVLCLLMNVPFLSMTPLAGTEGHRALTGHEMVRTGQWLVPMMYGRPYLAKPPLHYWLIASVEKLTVGAAGADVFVWRLPSALGGAALAAIVCLFASRWFGRAAAWVAGGCAVGLIALWGEHQVADLDATNTLAATLAALATIELLFGRPNRPWAWILGTGLAVAATLMAKGPAGLPILVGVWAWAAVVAVREGQTGRLASPRFWLPPLIGTALFAAYAGSVYLFLRRHGIVADWGGLREGAKTLHPATFVQVLRALEVPVLLPVYALPVSLALPGWFLLPVRRVTDVEERRVGTALAAAVLIGWGVGLLSGMVNPRYGYPTLPTLCPLAGAAAVVALRLGGKAEEWLRVTAVGVAVTLAGAAVALAAMAWKQPGAKPYLVASAALAVGSAVWVVRKVPTSWRAAGGLLLLAVLASVPFGFQRCLARTPISGLYLARDLVARAGERPRVAMGKGLTWKPEIFYYANAQMAGYMPTVFDPAHVPPGTWLFMDAWEYKLWRRLVGSRLTHDKMFHRAGESDFYLAWYGPPADPPNAPPAANVP